MLLTAEEFLVHAAAREHSELVRGEIRVMTPASGAHGVIGGNLFFLLCTYVREHKLGRCFMDGTGFALPNRFRTVRSPDVAFLRSDQLPAGGFGPGFPALAPDLAVEVLSPDESAADLEDKIADYHAAGTRLVWVIDPATRVVTVVDAEGTRRRFRERDTLDGGDAVPGFMCDVASLFEGVAR